MTVDFPRLFAVLLFSMLAVVSSAGAQTGGAGIVCVHSTRKVWDPDGTCPNREYFARTAIDSTSMPGFIFLPDDKPVSFVVVLLDGGLVGHVAFDSRVWRGLCLRFSCAILHVAPETKRQIRTPADDPGRDAKSGSGKALLALLDTLARRTGHRELSTVPLALWGFSATGSFAMTFTPMVPERVFAVVRVHSNLRDLPVDTSFLRRIPTLMLGGELDRTAGIDDMQKLWLRERQLDAPWAFAIEPGRDHVSLDSWFYSSELVWRWIDAFRPGGAAPMNTAHERWLGDIQTGAISSESRFAGDKKLANWFPDSVTADAWRRLRIPPK